MSLAAVILNWNQAGDTIACARSLEPALRPGDTVWIVDNASTGDDPQRIAEDCPGARLLAADRNLGFGGGNNLALREILDEAWDQVLLLNNDARIGLRDLEALRRCLEGRPDLAVLGPGLYDGDDPERLLSAGGRDIARHVATHETAAPGARPAEVFGDPASIREVDYVPGTCALLPTAALRRVGLFDEDYFFAGEMADLCRRAADMGLGSAVLGSARALHYTSRSSALRGELYGYYILRNRFLYVERHLPAERGRLRLEWTLRGLRFWLEAVGRGDRRRARALRLAVVDGWRGRYGDRNRAVLGERAP